MNQDDTKLYDIYLRAFIMTRAREVIEETRDLSQLGGAANAFGDVPRTAYSGKELFAFAIGVSDGSVRTQFPRTQAQFREQVNR